MNKLYKVVICLLVLSLLCGCTGNKGGENMVSSDINVSSDSLSEKSEIVYKDDWREHPEDYKLIALTFDDGPLSSSVSSDGKMIRIVNTLVKYDGAGTFFVIGKKVDQHGVAELNYAVSCGFEIGSHTYTHSDITSATFKEQNKSYTAEDYYNNEIIPVNKLLKEKMNYDVKFIRASGAHVTDYAIEACARAGMPIMCGNQNAYGVFSEATRPLDWSKETEPEHIETAVVDYAYDGKVVVLHATSETMVSILDDMCKKLYEKGYRFVTLSEMLEYKLGVTDVSKVDVAKSLTGQGTGLGIYDIDDVVLK